MTRFTQTNVNWRIRVKGKSFEDYWAERPSKLRNTARRRAKTAGLRIEILERFDEKAWADYQSVYAASWKPAEGSPELMRRFVQAEAAAGTLRLGLAYMGDEAVAAQLWTVEHGVATIHKLAYREARQALFARHGAERRALPPGDRRRQGGRDRLRLWRPWLQARLDGRKRAALHTHRL
jgi:hypothetical protein